MEAVSGFASVAAFFEPLAKQWPVSDLKLLGNQTYSFDVNTFVTLMKTNAAQQYHMANRFL